MPASVNGPAYHDPMRDTEGWTLHAGTFRCLSFDCYGTIVDWEAGILTALAPVLRRHRISLPEADQLALFAEGESALEAGPFRRYRDVLAGVLTHMGASLGFEPSEAERAAFAGSVGDWPPFPDSAAALTALGRRHKLIVLSNVDDDLFAGTARALGVRFDAVFTAERIGSYKPDPRNFDYLLANAGVAPGELLHCAQSLFHDIAPARNAGLATVWVNRQTGRQGSATPVSDARPHLTVSSLAELAAQPGLA